ncbi:hypothetical protein ACI2S3_11205 [Ralstonia nicotianae]|uniref:Uncharacterized protein n=2 Tax=Ralstonia solanacearum species complex TaxID=3116862 RepID=A0A0S4WVS6_RALSL|nr:MULTISPECIES: hypothetical protein [Ralstonia]AXV74718.1 hypothetical protein CJO75_17160 [Ralstonia solanacearum]AXW16516.1 hypothetical protein CJO84_17460 [Ralstonia solanacearum]AXW40156.1 hypothetical protein CJO89_17820 [Ralstonia solanacearum]AXW72947.1 hypothetical protein CJO96_17175 [Ralstonia solanacearum]AZU58893.1 hypothetical protein CFM90_22195 [Ralstonia solanacearum]
MSSISVENRTDRDVLIAIYSPFGPITDGPVKADETKKFALGTLSIGSTLKVLAHYPVEEPHTWTATIKHTLRHQESDVIVLTGGPDGGDWRTA